MISVIIPTLNELRHGMIEKALQRLQAESGDFEVIIVDAKSTDETKKVCVFYGFRVLELPNSNRAQRMNFGAKQSKGDIFLFHHPRSVLPKGAITSISRAFQDQELLACGFQHRFDQDHPLLRFTSWYSNQVRSRRGVIYLDHCYAVRKESFNQVGTFPNLEIFEDSILPQRISRLGKTRLLEDSVITSATRFRSGGIYRHALKNQLLKAAFHLGIHKNKLNSYYEAKNPLNQAVKELRDLEK